MSDTALRARRDEWIDAAVDGSIHKVPCCGEGTGKSPVDRGKLGWKWSLLCDRGGIPVAWTADAANRNDCTLLEPTVAAAGALAADVETLHLDRGYDNATTKASAASMGIDDVVCVRKRTRGTATAPKTVPLGMRWSIERTYSWLSNYGQLRLNTNCWPRHRLARLALTIALLRTAKLIDWRDRWSPK